MYYAVAAATAASRRSLERSQSQPVEQAFSYNTLSHMNPRTYRNHAWAQLAKSETFYVRGSPEERQLQKALGLIEDEGLEDEEAETDVEAPGTTCAEACKVSSQCTLTVQ